MMKSSGSGNTSPELPCQQNLVFPPWEFKTKHMARHFLENTKENGSLQYISPVPWGKVLNTSGLPLAGIQYNVSRKALAFFGVAQPVVPAGLYGNGQASCIIH